MAVTRAAQQQHVLFADTTSIADAIQTRRVSCVEALEQHLTQIEKHNRALNAIVVFDLAAARERAREADAALARREIWGPLHGVPFTLKDAFATAGVRSTVGFPAFDHVSTHDSTVAARLKAAGGILMGKTNVATLLGDFQTSNSIFGRTNNPWHVHRTPGGSSGGAAAAVAAGMTSFDIGTDLSGSIRLPAHFCGLFGLKPTEHRVSLDGVVPDPRDPPRTVRVISSIGPLARSVDDLALLFSIIAGPDGRDTDVAPVPLDEMQDIPLEGLRIAVAPTFPRLPVSGDIRRTVESLGRRLAEAGAVVEPAELPDVDYLADLSALGRIIGMVLGAANPEQKKPPTLEEYMRALATRDRSIAAWESFFDRCDILLCAPSMTTAFTHCEPGKAIRVDGREIDYYTVSAHAALFNYTGHPALVMPAARDQMGLPIGIQLVGRRWSEARLLGAARAITAISGGFQKPPGF